MEIKYHENGVTPEYDENHMLTNNWDPNKDYGNEYVRVYFRIDTPSYLYTSGFQGVLDKESWHYEASDILKSLNIVEGCGYDIEKQHKKCAYLYCHPFEISGVVLKNDVKKIAEKIATMKLSTLRWVDIYETVYDMSDEEYLNYLDTKRDEIYNILFEKSKTKNKDFFRSVNDITYLVADKIRLPRLGYNDGKNYGPSVTLDYLLKTIDEMIEKGYLKSYEENNILYVRSCNKKELKENNIKIHFIKEE